MMVRSKRAMRWQKCVGTAICVVRVAEVERMGGKRRQNPGVPNVDGGC